MLNINYKPEMDCIDVEFIDLETFNMANDKFIRYDLRLQEIVMLNNWDLTDENNTFLSCDINEAYDFLEEIGVI